MRHRAAKHPDDRNEGQADDGRKDESVELQPADILDEVILSRQQQDAAASVPAALHASIPDQGRVLTFTRAVLVDPWASLRIDLRAGAVTAASWGLRATIMAATFLLLALVIWLGSARSEQTRR